jgi:geranylgeranyl reductase family protein
MVHYDAIVVGAGPAGSTAARALAQGGARVCLLDTAHFPRPKPCGGALSPRTLRHLPPGVEAVVRARVRRAVFTFRSGRPLEVVSRDPMGYMVCREEFDTWLKTQAEQAGAAVREGTPALAIEERETCFAVRVPDGVLAGDMIVGADGVHSQVAARLFPARPRARYLALEAEVPQNGGDLDDTVIVDVGAYPGGYAWGFPKGDRVSVGAMVEYARGRCLRRTLDAFLAGQPALPAIPSGGRRAAAVAAPCSGPVPCARSGVLLVGDAAHLADPFLGEGIYSAVRSGALAALALLQGRPRRETSTHYAGLVESQLWPDLMAASRIASLFHRMPRWWHHLLSLMPGSLSEVVGVLAGEQTYAGLLRQIMERVEAGAGQWVRKRLGVRPDGTTTASKGGEPTP